MHTTISHVLQLEFVEAFDLVYPVARRWRERGKCCALPLPLRVHLQISAGAAEYAEPAEPVAPMADGRRCSCWRRWTPMASKPVGRDAPAGADGRRWLLNLLVAMLLLMPMADGRRWLLNLLVAMLRLAPMAAMPCREGCSYQGR